MTHRMYNHVWTCSGNNDDTNIFPLCKEYIHVNMFRKLLSSKLWLGYRECTLMWTCSSSHYTTQNVHSCVLPQETVAIPTSTCTEVQFLIWHTEKSKFVLTALATNSLPTSHTQIPERLSLPKAIQRSHQPLPPNFSVQGFVPHISTWAGEPGRCKMQD